MAAGRIVALLTVAFLAAGAAFAGLVPLFQNPDESTHFDRVLWQWEHPFSLPDSELQVRNGVRDALDTVNLAEGGTLDWGKAPQQRPEYQPVGSADGPGDPTPAPDERCPREPRPTCQNYQYAHPPAYYVLLSPTTPALESRPVSHHVLALRLIGLLLAAPIVPLTFLAASEWFRGNTTAAVIATAVVAAAAPVASAAASVNNDPLVLSAAAATIALMTFGIRRGFTVRTAALLGLAVTVGLLTKAHFLAVAPLAGLAVLLRPATAKRRLHAAATFAAAAAPGAAYWLFQLARNGGFEPKGSEIVETPTAGPWNGENFASYALDQIDLFVGRSWGLYGWATVEVPHAVKLALTAAAVLLAAVWVVQVARRRVRFEQPAALVVALVPVALAAAALYASFGLYRDTGSVRGIVGRYVYPGLPVLAIGVAASLRAASLRPTGKKVQHGPSRAVVAATILLSQIILMAGSVGLALRGIYQTTDLSLLFDRASAVAPVARASIWAVACSLLWLAAVAAAAALTTRLTPPSAGPRTVRTRRG